MANGRAAVPTPRPSSSSGWFTGALVVGMNMVAGILIWSIWKGTGVSRLGPAAVFGLMVGAVLFVVGAARAMLDARAAHRDPHHRRGRPARVVSRFGHVPVAATHADAATASPTARPEVLFRPPEPESPELESPAVEVPASESPVFEPAVVEPAEFEPEVIEPARRSHVDNVANVDADDEDVDIDEDGPLPERQLLHPSVFGESARPAIEPGASRLPLAGLHGLGATMQARLFDHGLITQDDVAAVSDDELEDLAADLGTFPGRLAGWVAEARANLAAADPYMRSA